MQKYSAAGGSATDHCCTTQLILLTHHEYLDTSCKMLILQLIIRPEAEVESINHQQVLGSQWTPITVVHVCKNKETMQGA